ncbi:MAG: peptide-methionine (S)-S-oxide reductase MsrA [Nevskiales bacterium]
MNRACDLPGGSLTIPANQVPDPVQELEVDGEQRLVLAGGCFWCVEAVYQQLAGVISVESGYAGGTADTADYRTVCSGATDHAEVVRIVYDAGRTSFGQLLKIFFSVAHDPTQLNRQGNDVGRQYRSAIFYSDEAQREVAQAYIAQLNQAGVFKAPIQTTLEPLEAFYLAEAYHQDFAAQNPGQPYIQAVSMPKVEKLRSSYPDRLKSN